MNNYVKDYGSTRAKACSSAGLPTDATTEQLEAAGWFQMYTPLHSSEWWISKADIEHSKKLGYYCHIPLANNMRL